MDSKRGVAGQCLNLEVRFEALDVLCMKCTPAPRRAAEQQPRRRVSNLKESEVVLVAQPRQIIARLSAGFPN